MIDMAKGAGIGIVAAALGALGDVLEALVLLGAAGAAFGWLYARVLRPLAGTVLRVYLGVGALEDLPAFMDDTRERLEAGSENFRDLEHRVGAIETNTAEAANAARGVARELDVAVRRDT